VRAGDRDIAVGPATSFRSSATAADRAVDRLRARARSLHVGKLMDASITAKPRRLIPYCLALMQNVPDDEQKKLVQA